MTIILRCAKQEPFITPNQARHSEGKTWLGRLRARLSRRAEVKMQGREESVLPSTLASLQRLVRQAGAALAIHPQSVDIAARALGFGRLRVADVMVPRNRINALSKDASLEALKRAVLEDGHSHMPVYDGTLDHIVGILIVKDLLALAWEQPLFVLSDLLVEPYFAPETMGAADLLGELQRRRLHFAIAVDELGGTAGIVALEDLLEELVGEICGDCDKAFPAPMKRESDGAFTLQGSLPVRDANRELKLELPEGETFSTVGGLCVRLAGRIPETGHKLTVAGGATLEVVDASPRHVRVVRLRPPASALGAARLASKTWLSPKTN